MLRAINIHQPQPKSRGVKKKPQRWNTTCTGCCFRLRLPGPFQFFIFSEMWATKGSYSRWNVSSLCSQTAKLFTCIRNGKRKPLAKHVQVVSLSGRHAHCYQDKLFLSFFCVGFFLRVFGSFVLMVESLYGQNNGFMLTTSGCVSICQAQRKHFNSASPGVIVFIFFFFFLRKKLLSFFLLGTNVVGSEGRRTESLLWYHHPLIIISLWIHSVCVCVW